MKKQFSQLKRGVRTYRPQQLPAKGDAFVYHASNSRRFRCLCRELHNWSQSKTLLCEKCKRMHVRGNEWCPIETI